jgi:type I restriction enzyme, S subunit
MVKQGYKQTDIGIIPEDWEVTSLGEIGFFKNGINKSKEDFGFGFPFVNLMDVFGKSSISTSKGFDFINSNNLERKLYNIVKNDVLFIRSSVKPSGVGLTSVITQDLLDVAFSGFIIRFRDNNYIELDYKKHCFFETNFRNRIIANSSVSANTNINQESLKSIQICLPKLRIEQIAIAKVLTDMDDLITNLTELIAKKKLIKVGAMQVLLTPKEDWEVKKLGDIADIYTGKRNNQDKNPSGMYPFFVRSQNIEKINTFSFDGEAILIPGEGNIGKIFHYMNGKFDFHQRVYMVSKFKDGFFGRYIYRYISEYFGKHAMENSVKATVDSLRLPTFQVFEIPFPPTYSEQIQIAKTLSDIDKEIQDLEAKLAKYKLIKIGAMQKLLTGEIRLV